MVIAFLILAGSVVTLAGLRLWSPKDYYYVHYKESVSGLEAGATVRMKGVRVGVVESIRINPKNVEQVIVTLALTPKTPIKTNTKAVITSIGITGLKFIEITGGSTEAALVKANDQAESIIPPGDSDIGILTGQAKDIGQKIEKLVNNLLDLTDQHNRAKVQSLLDNAAHLAASWATLVTDNQSRIKRIVKNVDRTTHTAERAMSDLGKVATQNAEKISATINEIYSASKAINKTIQGLKPQLTMKEIMRAAVSFRQRMDDPSITATINAMRKAATDIAHVSSDLQKLLRRRNLQLDPLFRNLDAAARHLKDFSRAIKERPSLLLRGETVKEKRIP
jgi:phospholipid/cholesterol/gamma-HCH transport system substrate-binding protein